MNAYGLKADYKPNNSPGANSATRINQSWFNFVASEAKFTPPSRKEDKLVSIKSSTYTIWKSIINWNKQTDTSDKLGRVYKVMHAYSHFNGETYYSLYDQNNNWQGYINASRTKEVASQALKTMQITIFGGSGFIGQKLSEELINRGHHVTSISRSGKPSDLTTPWSQKVLWLRSDILTDDHWHSAVHNADWVIDAIGTLRENPSKNITYERFILEPVRIILAYLNTQATPAKFLFLSANSAPSPLRKYMNAKLQAEQLIKEQTIKSVIIYPSLVVNKKRFSSVIGAFFINLLKKIPGIKKLTTGYDPISREKLAIEIANILEGKISPYTHRRT